MSDREIAIASLFLVIVVIICTFILESQAAAGVATTRRISLEPPGNTHFRQVVPWKWMGSFSRSRISG